MPEGNVSRVFRDPVTGIIRCIYARIEPLEVISRLVESAFEIQDKTGEYRLLFDARLLPFTGSTLSIFERSELVARKSLGKAFRVAALFNDKIPVENARFMETVARNRGLEVTVHSDEGSALRWLGPKADTG
jgi:hypothetical protein